MPKHKVYWALALTILYLAVGVSVLAALAKHEPSFYRQHQAPPSEARKDLAYAFASKFGQMVADRNARMETWACQATDAQINCFFEEIFVQQGEAEGLRKLGISSPRVTFEDNHLRLAFRYGSGWFSTVISYDLKIWLVPKEANVIALEILSARAGALPISKQSILPQLSDFARKLNYKVTLYRYEGNPVALIELEGDQLHPKALLTTLQVGVNTLSIHGKTLEHAVAPLGPAKTPK